MLLFKKLFLGSLVWILVIVGGLGVHHNSWSSPGVKRTYLLTSTYGVLVGALTGVASLAFYENPSQKKRNIALGASLGLYTGIMLGTYVLFLAPDPNAPKSSTEEDSSDEEASNPFLGSEHQNLKVATVQKNETHLIPLMGWDFETRSFQVGLGYHF